MSWKMRWEIGWKITPIGQVSSSHYFTDTQEVMRWLEDMVDIFIYSILFHAATKLSSHRTKKLLAEKKNLRASAKSVGGSSPPEDSVNSVNSVGGL